MIIDFKLFDLSLLLDENFSIDFYHNKIPIKNSLERLNRGIIGICTQGCADIEINFIKYHIKKGVIFSAFPTQIMRQKYVSDDFSLIYIACSREMLQYVLLRFPPEFELFLKETPTYNAPETIYRNDIEFLKLVKSKYEDSSNISRSEIIISMIRIFYLEIFNKIQHLLSKNLIKHTRRMELMRMFINLVMQHYSESREVSFYAGKLNITPKYLSIVTQEENGKGAKKFIDEFIITEIKLQLKSTSKSVKEITAELNFSDQSFLCKYFKRHTGITPKQYRNN